MKLIHCADLHLDSKMSANLTIERAIERNNEICDTFKRLVEYAVANEVKAILISGDLFDTSRVTNKTRDYVTSIIENTPNIMFFYLRGNHDPNEKLSSNPDNLVTFSDEWKYTKIENVNIAGVEFTRGNAYSFYDKLSFDKDDINIVIMHGDASNISGFERINLELLKDKYIDYMALGHIHDHKYGELDSRGQWAFSGCLEGRGFDECGPKGFIEIETFEHSLAWKFIPFARREITEVEVDITDATNFIDIQNRVGEAIVKLPAETILRVVLTGKYELGIRKDVKQLVTSFNRRFYSFKVKDKSRLFIDPKTYENDISLKGEFIRSVMALGIPDEYKDVLICTGIQALSGEEIAL